MDEQIIERAVEAAAKANFDRYTDHPHGDAWEETPEQVKAIWRGGVTEPVTAALAEVEASIAAERDELAARTARVEAERDRLKRGGHTLGKIINRWGEAIIAATGSESPVDEDRYGDWQVIEERLAGLRPELVDLRARVARVEALHVEHESGGGCHECDWDMAQGYPCPTLKALRGES